MIDRLIGWMQLWSLAFAVVVWIGGNHELSWFLLAWAAFWELNTIAENTRRRKPKGAGDE